MTGRSEAPPPQRAPVITTDFALLQPDRTITNPTDPGVGNPLMSPPPDPDWNKKPLCGHGISVKRHANDLIYRLPSGREFKVPRPGAGKHQLQIDQVAWSEAPRFQSAVSVSYKSNPRQAGEFHINIWGVGRMDLDRAFWNRDVPPKTFAYVRPSGLGYESDIPQAVGALGIPRWSGIGNGSRYHFIGSNFSLYVGRSGKKTSAALVVDSADRPARRWPEVLDIAVRDRWGDQADCLAFVTYLDQGREMIDQIRLHDPLLATSTVQTEQGFASDQRTKMLAALASLGVKIEERGARFNGFELKVILDMVQSSKFGTGLVAEIKRRQRAEAESHVREESRTNSPFAPPGLTVAKDVMELGGHFDDEAGEVVIPGWIRGEIDETPTTIRHELAHALFFAAGLMLPGLPRPGDKNQTARSAGPQVENDMNEFVSRAEMAKIIIGPVDEAIDARTKRERVRRMMSSDHVLNQAFMQLHERFAISDTEQTGDNRGIDIADESRYMITNLRGDEIGHGFDNVNEFVASFVVSTLQFRDEMVEAIQKAGPVDATMLALLYSSVWERVNDTILNFSNPNPFQPTVAN